MAEPLFTEAEARPRVLELLALYDRDPDHLSPDEQALVMAIRHLERVGQEVIAALRNKIDYLEQLQPREPFLADSNRVR